jgi:hypothetical protein
VIERGTPIEFLDDADLKVLVDSQLQDSQVVVVIKTPSGVLNSIGCEPQQIIGVISDAFRMFKIKRSHWGVLCSPLIAVPTMALLNGAYDSFRDGSAAGL